MPAVTALPLAWNVASRKTAVSKPSRRTARKAIATRARAEPRASAAAAAPSSSPFMARACLRIQMIIQVTMATASAPTTVSSISC